MKTNQPSKVTCINKFCGKGKTYEQLQDCLSILKDSKSTRRKVLCAPTVQLLLEWCLLMKNEVGEKVFKTRCGRLFNITKPQIDNIANMLGWDHPTVQMAVAMKESSRSKISNAWSVILTTHTTGWARLREFGPIAETVFDEIPLDCVNFSDGRDQHEYEVMKKIKKDNLQHNVFSRAKALATKVQERRTGLFFYDHIQEDKNGKSKTTKHAIEYWNLSYAGVKSITFLSAMAEWTFLPVLAKLNGIDVEYIGSEEQLADAKEAMSRITFHHTMPELQPTCSKMSHFSDDGRTRSIQLKLIVEARNGYVIGFKQFESDQNRNVRFGLSGVNSLADKTFIGIDGLPRFPPKVCSGVQAVLQDDAGPWMARFQTQSIVQSLWRSGIREGKNIDVLIWSKDVVERFNTSFGVEVKVVRYDFQNGESS